MTHARTDTAAVLQSAALERVDSEIEAICPSSGHDGATPKPPDSPYACSQRATCLVD
jgi:hypothetical protein